MVTSENAIFKTKFNITSFISWKNHAMYLRYSVFYILNYSINFESCDVLLNVSTQKKSIFLQTSFESFGHETWPTNRYSHGPYFYVKVCMVWMSRSKIQVLFNL